METYILEASQYFTDIEWTQLESSEQLNYGRILYIYCACIHLGIKVETPDFMLGQEIPMKNIVIKELSLERRVERDRNKYMKTSKNKKSSYMELNRFPTFNESKFPKQLTNTSSINTENSKKSKWAQFAEFCKLRKFKLSKQTTVNEIADILKDYGLNMRKTDGSEYKESCIKANWNVIANILKEKCFKECNLKFNPFRDLEFFDARAARDAKRRSLRNNVNTVKRSAKMIDNENYTKMIKLWDENTPSGLQRKFFLIASIELGWKGYKASNCSTSFFKEEYNSNNELTNRIEYNPTFSETCQSGSSKLCESSSWLTANYNNPDLCPVRLYRKLLAKRRNITTDRLFLNENNNWRASNEWYKNTPIGKNNLAKWVCESAEKVGLVTKKQKLKLNLI